MAETRAVHPEVGSGFLWRVVSLACLAGGAYLISSGGPVSGSILLLVIGLGATGVAIGAGDYGTRTEGPLDLSARLGLGLLGGALGGATVLITRWALVSLGIPEAMGVELTAVWSGSGALLADLGSATVWGMVLGIVYPHVPGLTGGGRGALFSLVSSLYVLLWVYPGEGLGLFGVELGGLAFAFVIGLNAVWGAVTGSAIGWGETTEEAPVSRSFDR